MLKILRICKAYKYFEEKIFYQVEGDQNVNFLISEGCIKPGKTIFFTTDGNWVGCKHYVFTRKLIRLKRIMEIIHNMRPDVILLTCLVWLSDS